MKKYFLGILFCGLSFSVHSQWERTNYSFQIECETRNDIVVEFSARTNKNLYDSISLFREINKLISGLQMKGYIAASVDSLTIIDSLVIIYLYTGHLYEWGQIAIRSEELPTKIIQDFKRSFQQGKPIQPEEISVKAKKFLEWYEDNGYPFARVSFDSVRVEDSHINATVYLQQLNKIVIDSIVLKGDAQIHPRFIHRQSDISPGSLYSHRKIRNLNRTLNSLPYLNFARDPGIEFRPNGADLYLFIDRQRANRFQGLLGFMSDHRQSGKLVLNGDIQLGLMNSFGKGETLDLRWKKTDLNNQELDLIVGWPFLFGSPLGMEGKFHLFRFDTLYMNIDYRIALRFHMGGSGWMKAFYDGRSSSRIGNTGSANLNDFQSHLYGLGYEFNSLDNFYNPRRGFSLNSSLAFGKRSQPIVNTRKEVSNRFDIQVNASWFLPIAKQSALLFKSHTGSIALFEKGNTLYLLENEMHRLGGMNNIRGFDENSILASSYTSLTLEYRWLFDRYSNIFVFTDFMYYRKGSPAGLIKDTPLGFGIGLNLQTRAGMFSISYALGTQQGNPVELRAAKVHLGYISRF